MIDIDRDEALFLKKLLDAYVVFRQLYSHISCLSCYDREESSSQARRQERKEDKDHNPNNVHN